VQALPATLSPLAAAAIVLVVVGSGCRLEPRGGPVPQEVAEARRLSHEGLSAADQKDLGRAEVLLNRAVKSCPTDIEARRHYADVLWKRGERVEAVTQIAEALRLSPGETDLCITGGRMYLELGLLDDADRLANSAVQGSPSSAEAWHLHGEVALARGRAEEALADFHRSLAITPDAYDVLLQTAEVYRRLGRPQRSLSTLAVLSESYDPQQTPGAVLALEGLAQEALGRREDALESYRLAIARGGAPLDTAQRLAALEQAAALPSQSIVAEVPAQGLLRH